MGNFNRFETLISGNGNTCAFDGEAAVECCGAMIDTIRDMGLNPLVTNEFRQGIISLFGIEIINMPDLTNSRFILTPNHVSDFDAIILGLLHPKIRIVSKTGWTNNDKLRRFLDIHYDLFGLERMSVTSLRALINDAVGYFNGNNENKHYLVFSQGTISDFNNNSPERISSVAQKISERTNIQIVNIFIEQVSLYHPTRIVFESPLKLSHKGDFRKIWLESEKAMQGLLVPPARPPILSHKHANNNKPGDPFF